MALAKKKTKKRHVKNGAPVGERPSSLYSEATTTATTPTLDSPNIIKARRCQEKKRVSHWVKVSPIELRLDCFLLGAEIAAKSIFSPPLYLFAQSNAGSFKCFCVTGREEIFLIKTLRLRIWNSEKISCHTWRFSFLLALLNESCYSAPVPYICVGKTTKVTLVFAPNFFFAWWPILSYPQKIRRGARTLW